MKIISQILESKHRYTLLALLLLLFLASLGAFFLLYSPYMFQAAEEKRLSIKEIEEQIEQQGYDWTPVPNHFTEMSHEERQKWLGLIPAGDEEQPSTDKEEPEEDEARDDKAQPVPLQSSRGRAPAQPQQARRLSEVGPTLPERLDYSDYATPARDQGGCGSCWAFATVAAVETQLRRANPDLDESLNLSEQYLLSCEGSCHGEYLVHALEYLQQHGTVDERCCPYHSDDNQQYCASSCGEIGQKVFIRSFAREAGQGWRGLFSKPQPPDSAWIDQVRQTLYEKGPLVAAMNIQEDFWAYGRGVYRSTTSRTEGAHAVMLLGYNAAERYWLVKNSWGKQWGENGFAKISWDEAFSAFGFELYSLEVGKRGLPDILPQPGADPAPAAIRLDRASKDRLAGLVKIAPLSCSSPSPAFEQTVVLQAEAVDLVGFDLTDPALLARVTARLWVNGKDVADFAFNGNTLTTTIKQGLLMARRDLALQVKGHFVPLDDNTVSRPGWQLEGETLQFDLPYRLARTTTPVEPLSVLLTERDGRWAGDIRLPLASYYDFGPACLDAEFLLTLTNPQTRQPYDIWPQQVMQTGLNTAHILSLSLPATAGQEERDITLLELSIAPLTGDQDLVVPLSLDFAKGQDRQEVWQEWQVSLAVLLFVACGTLLLRHVLLVDKLNYWLERIAPLSPEDFWPQAGLFAETTRQQIGSAGKLAELATDPHHERLPTFLRQQDWTRLTALAQKCQSPQEAAITFPLLEEVITLASFAPGDRVFRARVEYVSENLGYIECEMPPSSPAKVKFRPMQGYFRDMNNCYLPLNQPIQLSGVFEFQVGSHQAGDMAVIQIALQEQAVVIRLLKSW